jgi:carbon storage regulator CsrA
MTTNEAARSRGISLVWSAVFRAIRLLIFGMIGWLLFVSAIGSAWRAVSLAAVLALAALVGITWYLSRASAESRWRAALDAYAEKELAKRTLTRGETFMLVLRRKIGERIVVPHFGFAVRVIAIEGKTVRLGISAPEDVAVYREEVWQQLRQQTHGPAPAS